MTPSPHPEPPADAQPQTQPAGDPADTLRAELDDAIRQAEEYLRLAQRTQADFVNYRRRVEEERQQHARDATLGLILKLLPILDDFERARAGATPAELESPWGKGVELVERNLRALLAAEGVERLEAEGAEFSPWEHEAVSYVPTPPDARPGQVVEVVRPGYRKGDRVIRPAQVVVAGRSDGG
jgi:molecular chaperone GrpE